MAMPNPDYSALVAKQREYFLSGETLPASWRKAQLNPCPSDSRRVPAAAGEGSSRDCSRSRTTARTGRRVSALAQRPARDTRTSEACLYVQVSVWSDQVFERRGVAPGF